MAEENQGEGLGAQEAPKLTEIENKALAQGWKPQDEWEGEPDAWRPAKEFLDRGELFKKIDEQSRTIKEFRKTLDEFGKHHARVREVEYKRALEELKTAKAEAVAEGNGAAVVDLDEKIDAVREAQRQPQPQVAQEPVLNPLFVAWREKNGWYDQNRAMRALADKVGNELGAAGGLSATEILTEVERQVKQEFAEKFQNPRRQVPSAVEGGGASGKGKGTEKYQATAEERRVAERFAKQIPGMTVEKYLAELGEANKRGV